jgi:hypothetical protein
MTKPETTLLPCPWCDGPAVMEEVEDNVRGEIRFSVGCNNYDAGECMGYQSLTTFARRSEAAAAWNRRPQPAPQAIEPENVAALAGDLRFMGKEDGAELVERLARERDEAIDALSTLVYRYDCEHEGEKPILAQSAIQIARKIIKRHAARQANPKENADER